MTLLVDENLLLHLIDALRIFERRSACQYYSTNLSILTVSARHASV